MADSYTANINTNCVTSHLIPVPNRLSVDLANPKSPYNRPPNTMEGFSPANTGGIEHVARIGSEVNVPDRFELFLLGDGEKKITEAVDTRKSHCLLERVGCE
jgi:hypothetical protein